MNKTGNIVYVVEFDKKIAHYWPSAIRFMKNTIYAVPKATGFKSEALSTTPIQACSMKKRVNTMATPVCMVTTLACAASVLSCTTNLPLCPMAVLDCTAAILSCIAIIQVTPHSLINNITIS